MGDDAILSRPVRSDAILHLDVNICRNTRECLIVIASRRVYEPDYSHQRSRINIKPEYGNRLPI
jgi:hypothetical protein